MRVSCDQTAWSHRTLMRLVVLATYPEEDNVLLSVFRLFYVQTPAVFRNGRAHTTGQFAGQICTSNLSVKKLKKYKGKLS